MPGHVFLARGDLTRLYCDAWLLPCDAWLGVTWGWRDGLAPEHRAFLDRLRSGEAATPEGWGDDGVRVIPFAGPTPPTRAPIPYLVNVGGTSRTELAWYLEGVRQFFVAVRGRFAEGRRTATRSKPLVGIPFIGTGLGGAKQVAGAVVGSLLDTLVDVAQHSDIDIVLVVKNAPAFAAAQNARRQRMLERGERAMFGPELDARLVDEARRLARHAATGHLVLFLGAGIGGGAGLPTWWELLDGLAADAGVNGRERAALAELHHLDRARLIEGRMSARGVAIGEAIRSRLSATHYSLAHGLLAGLPVSEVVTTNYDCLFESASSAAGREAAVLPYQSVAGRSRWLLKLHGSVTHPDDIVLTREDYLRYADRRAALAGIVQALLITRHMLFVGFSLSDDNFHAVVDAVRKAVRGTDGRGAHAPTFGTALLLRRDELLEELWKGDLDLTTVAHRDDVALPDAARRLEIFLDLLLSEATRAASPLLDPAYDDVLTPEERELRVLLNALDAHATNALRGSAAWRPVAELLGELGRPRSAD